jgi:hypothetical protein
VSSVWTLEPQPAFEFFALFAIAAFGTLGLQGSFLGTWFVDSPKPFVVTSGFFLFFSISPHAKVHNSAN